MKKKPADKKHISSSRSSPKFRSENPKRTKWLLLILAVAVTFITLSSAIKNEFVNWDDDGYVYNSPLTKSPELKSIFTQFVMGNYHPLAMLSLALDYKLYGLRDSENKISNTANTQISRTSISPPPIQKYDGTGYHVTSLLLHLCSLILLFFFCFQLTGEVWVAFIVAVLFGIHPMHVESVAWISERKDQLYVLFYFSSLLSYLYFIKKQNRKTGYYLLTLFLFLLSLLSKGQAVTLPLVLLLIDYFKNRKINMKVMAEKIPFFLLSLAFGIIAILAQKSSDSIRLIDMNTYYSFGEQLMFAAYALFNYLLKAILPLNLSAYYPYPQKVNGAYSFLVYLSPAVILIVAAFIFWKYRKNKAIIFGIFFFLFNIILLLQLLPIGGAIMADRYSYLSYTGLFFIAAVSFFSFQKKLINNSSLKILLNAITCIYLIFLCSLTFARGKVWRDSKTLWNDQLRKNPSDDLGYTELGAVYESEGKMDSALMLLSHGIKLQSHNPEAYVNRAYIYMLNQKADSAISDCSTALEQRPDFARAYSTRGAIYTSSGNLDAAMSDFKKYLSITSLDAANTYVNIGTVYALKGNYDSAQVMYSKAISLDPKNSDAYRGRGTIFKRKFTEDPSMFQKAMSDLSIAIQLNPSSGESYFQRSLLYNQIGNDLQALQDANTAMGLGKRIDPRYLDELKSKK